MWRYLPHARTELRRKIRANISAMRACMQDRKHYSPRELADIYGKKIARYALNSGWMA